MKQHRLVRYVFLSDYSGSYTGYFKNNPESPTVRCAEN